MKGIILAGGTGSRLYPLTKVTNKHLLPVGSEPMIYHPLRKLVAAGISEVLVVTGLEHMGAVVGALGSGREFGCQLTYRVQDEAGGIAQALALAEAFVGSDQMVVLLGDNIFQDDLMPFVAAYRQQAVGARLLLKSVSDPSRFGVPAFAQDKIVRIEEKPANPPSQYAVTGIYFYDAQVFDLIRQLRPSWRNELEITDVNNLYLARQQLGYDFLQGWWTDAGTFSSLAQANQLLSTQPV
ncbi:MAG: NTP transferase domain-containing protein [Candidatus Sericytochromatia bacterium]|nr:NTP transferase domain-containing protein [Candidatus Sericytochromatia bacterium]